jgi:protein-tyrosine phosphatase
MAAALFAERAGEGWRVESAGTWTQDGIPPSQGAVSEMAYWGLDITAHRSRVVTRDLLVPFDLILTMEEGHKEGLQIDFPEIADRVFLLSEMSGDVRNVDDPIGAGPEEYRRAAEEIDDLIDRGYTRIVELASLPHS